MKQIYLAGSLRNPKIVHLGVQLRDFGFVVFDDWHSAGHEADDKWKEYEQNRGRTYREALQGHVARHVFEFDKRHIDRSDIGVLVAPAGRSGYLELGYMIGCGKPGFILLEDNNDRWDVMVQFATTCFSEEELFHNLAGRQ